MLEGKVRFQVKTPFDLVVRTTHEYWRFITASKHPIIKVYEGEVKETLKSPDEIRLSRKDEKVFLFYKRYKNLGNRYICVLIKRLNGDGFIITAYMADNVKRGKIVWKKSPKRS
ncbi:MAG: DUF4258 domain-containing protein [Candidatus Hydrothermarchaeales archaeon]